MKLEKKTHIILQLRTLISLERKNSPGKNNLNPVSFSIKRGTRPLTENAAGLPASFPFKTNREARANLSTSVSILSRGSDLRRHSASLSVGGPRLQTRSYELLPPLTWIIAPPGKLYSNLFTADRIRRGIFIFSLLRNGVMKSGQMPRGKSRGVATPLPWKMKTFPTRARAFDFTRWMGRLSSHSDASGMPL